MEVVLRRIELKLTWIWNVGGAGLVGGALLMNAIEDHNEREREEGFEQGLYRICAPFDF